MPARNHAAFVGTALRSILAQSHPQLELIVIDDGSQDGTPDEIDRTLAGCRRQMRIEVHRQENRGLGRTLARGLALARGEFVQFLASDDALFPGMTARLAAALAAAGPEVAAVGCDGYVFDGRQGHHRVFSHLHPVPLGRNQHRELLVGNWFPAMGLLYRRDLLGGDMLQRGLVYEDWGLLLNLTRQRRILQIPDRLFLYRQHGSNTSNDPERMLAAHRALCAQHPAMARVRDWKGALLAGDLRRILAGLTPGNLDLAARFALRQAQRRLARNRAGGAQTGGPRIGRGVRMTREGGGRIEIGAGCTIGPGAVLAAGPGDLVLGPGCSIGAGARLVAGEGLTLGPGCLIEQEARLGGPGGPTRIGRACLVARGAQVAAGALLEEFSAVGPGLVVGGGHPAGTWILQPEADPPGGGTALAGAAP
jgi:acetyltransferase-like isoleucine patch superfamily enzyme